MKNLMTYVVTAFLVLHSLMIFLILKNISTISETLKDEKTPINVVNIEQVEMYPDNFCYTPKEETQ